MKIALRMVLVVAWASIEFKRVVVRSIANARDRLMGEQRLTVVEPVAVCSLDGAIRPLTAVEARALMGSVADDTSHARDCACADVNPRQCFTGPWRSIFNAPRPVDGPAAARRHGGV